MTKWLSWILPPVPGHPDVRNWAPLTACVGVGVLNLPFAALAVDPWVLLITVVASGALLFLDRYPWALTAVLLCGGALSRTPVLVFVPFWVAACLAPAVLLSVRKVNQTCVVVMTQAGLTAVYILIHPAVSTDVMISTLVFLGIGVGAGYLLYRPQIDLEKLQAEHDAMMDARRREFAQEIHDRLARRMTHMIIYAEQAKEGRTNPEALACLDDIIATGQNALLQLRQMMRVLREVPPEDPRFKEIFPPRKVAPLPPDPPHIANRRSRRHDPLPWLPAVRMSWDPPEPPFEPNPQWEPLHPRDGNPDSGEADGQ